MGVLSAALTGLISALNVSGAMETTVAASISSKSSVKW
jgi:hypothetical protein